MQQNKNNHPKSYSLNYGGGVGIKDEMRGCVDVDCSDKRQQNDECDSLLCLLALR